MRVFLIGFMGSGKSKKGKKLAALLKYSFVDMDEWIENKEACTISEIFENRGEVYFRKIENEALRQLCKLENVVIATGGGTPCYFDAINAMLESGTCIYLKANAAHLKNRLTLSKKERPLVKNLEDEELLAYIENKLKEREIFYNQAQLSVPAADLKAGELYSSLQAYLHSK